MTQQVGVLELTSKYRYGLTSRGAPLYLFKPYDKDQPDLIVGSTHRDLGRNQIAIVDPQEIKHLGRGNLLQLIGPVGDYNAERDALLRHYCPHTFKVIALVEPNNDDQENRIPLDEASGWTTFHIDPPGCRDIDDAIAYNHDTKTWAITIADADAAVPAGSDMDRVAATVGATFYDLEGRVVRAMLPQAISEESASLLPGARRRGVTLFLHPDGRETFGLTWITVAHSFTYESFVGSNVAFDLQVSKEPHAWIEELMIRYNRAAARVLKAKGMGILRVQPPSAEPSPWAAIDPAF